jgi:hypothetical protein
MAMEIGYRYSDIVIAYNLKFKWSDGTETPKFTIARRDSNVRIDLKGLQEKLNEFAKGKGLRGSWGGQENIIGSPQNEDPQISVEELLEIVGKYLKREQNFILIGSRARGEAKPSSDWDVLVKPSPPIEIGTVVGERLHLKLWKF